MTPKTNYEAMVGKSILAVLGLVLALIIVHGFYSSEQQIISRLEHRSPQQIKRDACILEQMNLEKAFKGSLVSSYSDFNIYCMISLNQ